MIDNTMLKVPVLLSLARTLCKFEKDSDIKQKPQ